MSFKDQLIQFFYLTENKSLFMTAIHPKSCGGGKDFKFLALFGDNVLNLSLLEIVSRDKTRATGELTEAIQAFHNKKTLIRIARYLKIPTVMVREFEKECFTNNDLKESVEALLGATYQINGLETCKQVITKMVQISQENAFFNPNPIGFLQILFQKKNFLLPEYHTTRAGGSDHQSKFRCTVKGDYEGKKYEIRSGIHSSKKEAEKDAARLFLKELGEENKLDVFHFANNQKTT